MIDLNLLRDCYSTSVSGTARRYCELVDPTLNPEKLRKKKDFLEAYALVVKARETTLLNFDSHIVKIKSLLAETPLGLGTLAELIPLKKGQILDLLEEMGAVEDEDGKWHILLAKAVSQKQMEETIDSDKKLGVLKAENSSYRKKYKSALERVQELETSLEFKSKLAAEADHEVIVIPPSTTEPHECVPLIALSDWHVGEKVDPSTINNLNEYNPDIARFRSQKVWANILKLINKERSTSIVNNIVVWLGGDFITGYIHEELMESNYMSPIEEVLFTKALIISGFDMLLEKADLENIIVPCSYGNHCVDADTEILTSTGWVPAKDVNKETFVASFNQVTRLATYSRVVATTETVRGEYYLVSGVMSNEKVSYLHNIYYRGELRPVYTLPVENTAADFTYACISDDSKEPPIDVGEVILITWLTFGEVDVNGDEATIFVDTPEAYVSLTNVLEYLSIPGSVLRKSETVAYITFKVPYYLEQSKWFRDYRTSLPTYFRFIIGPLLTAMLDVLKVCCSIKTEEELICIPFLTKHNADTIQQACVVGGIPCLMDSTYYDGEKVYNIFPLLSFCTEGSGTSPVRIQCFKEKTKFYGIETVNGTLITRRDGKVNLTGNSRITQKTRISTGAFNSFEYLMYTTLKEHYSKEPRIQFHISKGYLTYLTILNKVIRFCHGDLGFKFQGGVGGISIGLNKIVSKFNDSIRADMTVMGHFHTLKFDSHWCVNGSLIGAGPYSLSMGFSPERPQQMFRLIDSKYGFTGCYPILCE